MNNNDYIDLDLETTPATDNLWYIIPICLAVVAIVIVTGYFFYQRFCLSGNEKENNEVGEINEDQKPGHVVTRQEMDELEAKVKQIERIQEERKKQQDEDKKWINECKEKQDRLDKLHDEADENLNRLKKQAQSFADTADDAAQTAKKFVKEAIDGRQKVDVALGKLEESSVTGNKLMKFNKFLNQQVELERNEFNAVRGLESRVRDVRIEIGSYSDISSDEGQEISGLRK